MGMEQGKEPASAYLRAALTAARDALAQAGGVLASLSAAELAEVMTLADDVAAQAGAVQVQIVGEAASRGEFSSARRGAGSGHEWVRQHAPSLRQSGAGQVAQFAQAAAAATPPGSWLDGRPVAGAYADLDRPEGIVWARVASGEVSPALALTALREVARLADRLVPQAVPTVTGAILDHGTQWGLAEAKKVRAALLATHGADGEFDDTQRALRAAAFLSSPQVGETDVSEYRMAMTPEQAARLEAAIGPLSRPEPNPETGEADHRSSGQRRVEALHCVLGSVAAADSGGRSAPGAAATVVHVTIPLARLVSGLACSLRDDAAGVGPQTAPADGESGGDDIPAAGAAFGVVLGSRAQGTKLAPTVVRQLACDAEVIPVVLGAEGEVVDLGRATRLFTLGQRRFLWHRDRQCTFPGCDVSASWAQAHHLIHWVDGGPSDISNAALLCQRHHTQVHDQRLIATIGAPDAWGRCVTWDLTPGSYDRVLPARLQALRVAGGPRHRRRAPLDTGPPDEWASLPPAEIEAGEADEVIAEYFLSEVIPPDTLVRPSIGDGPSRIPTQWDIPA